MDFYGKLESLEGEPTWALFGVGNFRGYILPRLKKAIEAHYAEGKQICIEFKDGARKGTIALVSLDVDNLDALFKEANNNLYGDHIRFIPDTLDLSAEGRSWTIESSYRKQFTGVLRFNSQPKFVYEVKKKTDEEKAAEKLIPVIKDHFGNDIAVGSFVIFPMGTKGEIVTRFGFVEDISPRKTIKLRAIKTRPGHADVVVTLSPLFSGADLIIVDSDIKNKAMKAKLGL